MRRTQHRTSVTVSASAYLAAAVIVLLLPIRWFAAWAMATVVHELFHFLAIRGYGIPVYCIRLGADGIRMETGPMSCMAEFFCALAGPVGALLLLFAARYIPTVAICAYVQSVYNLLPVYPLDGGRALRCALLRICSAPAAERIAAGVEYCVLAFLTLLGFWACFRHRLGPVPVIAVLILLFRRSGIKIPCKDAKLRVQ